MNLTRLPPVYINRQTITWVRYIRIWRKLSKLEQISRDDLWPIRVLRVPAQRQIEYRH